MAYQPIPGSVISYQSPGSILSASVFGTVNTQQAGTRIVSVISSIPSSMLAGASIFGQLPAGTAPLGSVATLQGTNPWVITGNNNSIIGVIQSSVAVAIVSGSVAVATGNSSVMLLNGPNVIGSVATLQGTNPWIVIASVMNIGAPTSSVYAVLSSVTTVSILNANTSRRGATIYNKAGTDVFIKLGTVATTSVYTLKMSVDDYYELPYAYTGVVAGITASNAGIINVTELT